MDPFAALSLASNIVQFLDFGGKLISGVLQLYDAADGATSSNSVLEAISTDLDRLCAGLVMPVGGHQDDSRTEFETALRPLAESCHGLAQEFVAVLGDLKVQGCHKKWESLRQAFRSIWKQKDIQRYNMQLDQYRSQITIRLLSFLTSVEFSL